MTIKLLNKCGEVCQRTANLGHRMKQRMAEALCSEKFTHTHDAV